MISSSESDVVAPFMIRGDSLRLAVPCLLASAVFPSVSRAQVPVFEVDHADSSVKFNVKASVAMASTFDKWDASLTLTSPDLISAVLDIKIQGDSVNTGSGMKDGKLKGKDFFDVKHSPLITFHSTKVVQTGPDTVEFDGDFTIRARIHRSTSHRSCKELIVTHAQDSGVSQDTAHRRTN